MPSISKLLFASALISGWQLYVSAPQQPAASTQASQTIRIEPVDATHIRIRMEGKEQWVIEAAAFDVTPNNGALHFAARDDVRHGRDLVTHAARSFTLTVAPTGVMGFHVTSSSRLPK